LDNSVNPLLIKNIIDEVCNHANNTASMVPIPDLYDLNSSFNGFSVWPVMVWRECLFRAWSSLLGRDCQSAMCGRKSLPVLRLTVPDA